MFKDFVSEGKVRKASPDLALAKSLVSTAELDLVFLQKTEITKYSARKVISNYYDVLRSIIEAIAVLDGYKVYSHEAFTPFLKEMNEELISTKFDRFRKIRNRINYYGEGITIEEVKQYREEILVIINTLREKYLRRLG
ncbi:hypothetical protein HYS47_02130 [Candidatus Woesearchaeota archaeon]|nr:hypothetical protein [Candidatus Woesearchaeota archaeon]